jgi:hypothetical protein
MLVFVDESGDPGMKGKPGTSGLFVISGVIFAQTGDAQACDKRIDKLRKECFGSQNREFKFNKCCEELRKRFLCSVVEQEFRYWGFVLNKSKLYGPGFQYKESFYKYTSKLLFENAKSYLSNATVVIDGSGNREFRNQLQTYLKSKINTEEKVIKKVKIEGSHSNNLLQLADMIAGALARHFREDKNDRFEYRKIVQSREIGLQVWPRK